MSALDQAFIRAYARDQTACDATQPSAGDGDAAATRPVSAGPADRRDDLADPARTWHRLEQPSGSEAGAAPPPHAPFSRVRDQRTTPHPHGGVAQDTTRQRRPESRLLEVFSAMACEPLAPQQAVSQHSVAATTGDLAAPVCGAGTVSTPLLPIGVQAYIGLPAMPPEIDSPHRPASTENGPGPPRPAGSPVPISAAREREVCRSEGSAQECCGGCACCEAPERESPSKPELVEERPAPSAAPSSVFCPSWEVDRFCWPSVCERLSRCGLPFLDRAGERLQAAAGEGLKVLAITSAESGEGCSTLAMCLARSAAASGSRVALMELDFNPPRLAARLGVEAACSWWDAVSRRLPLAEAAVLSLEDQLTLLPATLADQGRRTALDEPTVVEAIQQAASALDIVVIDLGPIAAKRDRSSDTRDTCPIDAAIVVRDVRRSTEERAREIAARLHEMGIEAVGIAENFVPDRPASESQAPSSLK